MYSVIPRTSEEFERLSWAEIEPWYRELQEQVLTQEDLDGWLRQWSRLSELVDEVMVANEIACARDTGDQEREQRQQRFAREIHSQAQGQEQKLKQQLLASGLQPENFTLPLRNLRAEVELFRTENVALQNEERRLTGEYFQVGGQQTVEWEGEEVGIGTLWSLLSDPARARRERAWRTIHQRLLVDKAIRNEQWIALFKVRQQMAQNSGYTNYRDYRWRELLRFDYSPEESLAFHELIKQELMPVVEKLWKERRAQLGVETLRPWDQRVSPWAERAPRQIKDIASLLQKTQALFQRIEPRFGQYFQSMIDEGLLDLDARPGKANAAFNAYLQVRQQPFIFGQITSIQDILPTLCHETGHALHSFEMRALPYIHQRKEGMVPTEFAEVASTTMELIGALHLHEVGLCSEEEARQIRIQHLEQLLMTYIPPIVQGDAFQHWIYAHPDEALDPERLDQKWAELSKIYLPALDWSGLETELGIGWQRVLHLYYVPFYLLEYVFAAMGALQIWQNYERDPQRAIEQYRRALAMGATGTVPDLYATAGARFALDAGTLRGLVRLVMSTLKDLKKTN